MVSSVPVNLCAAIICKNESHIIDRCLNSIKPIIDFAVILDTGSTDNTEEVIHETLKEIKHEVHHAEWQDDFAKARNQSFQLARDKGAKYILWIDCDDYVVAQDYEEFTRLSDYSHHNMEVKHGTISYWRPHIISGDSYAQWHCPLHEYIDVCGSGTDIRRAHIVFGGCGNRSSDPDKYIKDAAILEKALTKEEYNHLRPRLLFYLGNSYKDSQQWDKALEVYERRANAGGYLEEQYVSLLEIGKILEIKNEEESAIEHAYIRCHNRYPLRAEALCYLASYYQRHDNFEKGYFFASQASNFLRTDKALFVEGRCYSWWPNDIRSVCASYMPGKKNEAIQLNRLLLQHKDIIPPADVTRIENNLKIIEG